MTKIFTVTLAPQVEIFALKCSNSLKKALKKVKASEKKSPNKEFRKLLRTTGKDFGQTAERG